MARFFIIASLLLSFYAGCCSLGLWMSMAHSGGDAEAPFSVLAGFVGDKNSDEYTKRVWEMKEAMREKIAQRNKTKSSYAYTFAFVSVFQFFTMLWLPGRRGQLGGRR